MPRVAFYNRKFSSSKTVNVEVSSIVNSDSNSDPASVEESITQGDYVKVIAGMFRGYYAVVQGDGYRDEIELQYFKEKNGKHGNYWVQLRQ